MPRLFPSTLGIRLPLYSDNVVILMKDARGSRVSPHLLRPHPKQLPFFLLFLAVKPFPNTPYAMHFFCIPNTFFIPECCTLNTCFLPVFLNVAAMTCWQKQITVLASGAMESRLE